MQQCKQLVREKSAECHMMLAQDEAGVRFGSLRRVQLEVQDRQVRGIPTMKN